MSIKPWVVIAAILLVLGLAIYTQITIFVIQPIGAVPEGRTLIILRLNDGKFIDSADAMCVRRQESVNLLCRAVVLGAVGENATILVRLPYSETLYLKSTGGKSYSR